MKKIYQFMVTTILVAISSLPGTLLAESNLVTGAGNLTTNARLNLRVTIPQFLFFRVGTVGGSVDQITFAPAAANVGDSSSISGSGGDAASGSGASVALRSNAGAITITEDNNGAGSGLSNGAGGNISLSEITVTSDNPSLETPTLSDAGNLGTSSPSLNAGNVTNRTAVWTYAYDNTTTPDEGNYDIEITYTAANF